jgi:hypothetical protein
MVALMRMKRRRKRRIKMEIQKVVTMTLIEDSNNVQEKAQHLHLETKKVQ